MGVGGSKHGIGYRMEKHRAKQLSKRRPVLWKVIGNSNLNADNALDKQSHSHSQNPATALLEPVTAKQVPSQGATSTEGMGTSKGSLNEEIPATRSHCSSECLTARSDADNLSRELVLTSSPHYKQQEFFSEESSPGGGLISSGPIGNSNKDINHSENYSNTLDSQECINVTSSTEDMVGGNLSDSGYHFDQQANKHFSTQSVKKVILDLSQQKYIGLSLVGGADSPFGNLPVLVKDIMSGGAAECCDISRGDEILGINNVSLEDKPLQFAVERLRHCSSRDEEIILWIITQLNSN